MVLISFLWVGPYSGKLHAAGASESIQNLGFTLVQGAPLDFDLARVGGAAGAKAKLKDFRGKWILLSFWATWCGPCVQEMPALNALFHKYRDRGLALVAVSVDEDRSTVEGFVRDQKIDFPVLHDPSGGTSNKYRASALPTLFLISPDWKLAGMMRGARDWTSPDVATEVDSLLKFRKYDEPSGGVKMEEAADGALAMPNNLAPPELSLGLPVKVYEGADVSLLVAVSWKGNSKDYLIKTPSVTLPTGVTQGEVSSSSTASAEATTLSYQIPLHFEKVGSHKIGPIELAYQPRAGGKELFSRNEGLTVEVEKGGWSRNLILSLFLGAGSLLAGLGVWYRARRRRKLAAPAVSQAGLAQRNGRFEEIRQMKMRGQANQYAAALLKMAVEVGGDGPENGVLRAQLEKMRFGGLSLSEAELVSLEKKIERSIKESR